MTYENILFASEGGIARLTLNRPDRLNSFNDQMHAEVRDALGSVNAALRISATSRFTPATVGLSALAREPSGNGR